MFLKWVEQRREILRQWKHYATAIERKIIGLPPPAPTLFRERDAKQAVAHAEASVYLLMYAAEVLKTLAEGLAPHLNDCIGYDITDAMVIDLDLPTMEQARAWAEAKHEYTDEDAEADAAEHRGDLERDGE